MIEEIQEYLSKKLYDAGIETKICTTMEELKNFDNQQVGGVIVDKDTLTEHKKIINFEIEGRKFKRKQLFKRETRINVIIGEFEALQCDEIFIKLISLIDKGFYDKNGNYVYLDLQESLWIESDYSISKSNITVKTDIICTSGIYKDSEIKQLDPIPVI